MKDQIIKIDLENLNRVKELLDKLSQRISDLEYKVCDCCTTDPLISTMEGQKLSDFTNGSDMDFSVVLQVTNPNDRFPIPTCAGRKGIIFLDDATVYCQFHDQDGWVIVNITRCENFIN